MHKVTVKIIVGVSAVFLCVPIIAGAQSIGNGYTCDGTTILNKNDKVVALGKARAAIQNKIEKIVGTSTTAKNKRKALRGVKSNLTKCSRGEFAGGIPAGNLVGIYSGSLALIKAEGDLQGCEKSDPLEVSFTVIVEGSGLRIDASNPGDPFHVPAVGNASGSGFLLSRSSGSVVNEKLDILASDVTETTATLRVSQALAKTRGPSCMVVFTGPVTRAPLP